MDAAIQRTKQRERKRCNGSYSLSCLRNHTFRLCVSEEILDGE